MTLWYDLLLIRIVRLVENAVEWRRKLAGKVAEVCRFRTGSDRRKGSDRTCELTKEIRTGLELVTGGGLARRKAVYLELEWIRDRIGRIIGSHIGST